MAQAEQREGAIDARVLRRAFVPRRVPDREVYRYDPGRGLNLDVIANAIRQAEIGYMQDLADVAGKVLQHDPTLSSLWGRRRGMLEAAVVDVIPASGRGVDQAKAALYADVVRHQLDHIHGGMAPIVASHAHALWDGRSATEHHWDENEPTGDYPVRWTLSASSWIHPRRLSFGERRELRLVDRVNAGGFKYNVGPDLEELEPFKFAVWKPRLFNEYPEREGLAPRCLYWALFKRFAARERMILAELFGKPWKILEVDADNGTVTEEALDEALDEVDALGATQQAMRLPRGVKLNTPWPDPRSGEIHAAIIQSANDELAKLILGQTMTTDDGSSRAQAEVHERQQDSIHATDLSGMSAMLTRGFVVPIVALNFGAAELCNAPAVRLRPNTIKDVTIEQGRIRNLISMGAPVPLDIVYEASGVRKPGPTETVVRLIDTDMGPQTRIVEPTAAEAVGLTQAAPQRAPRLRQPSTVHGSPDGPITRGVRHALRLVDPWLEDLVEAATRGDFHRAEMAIADAAKTFDTKALAETVERQMVHGLMLGVLDADWDAEHQATIAPERFSLGGVDDFATKPFDEAVEAFQSRSILDYATFDRLRGESKRQAFSVATLFPRRAVAAAHGALLASIEGGESLSSFRERLDVAIAPYNRLGASHVETVFRNAVMGSYADGRHEQMTQPAVLRARPYWQVLGVNDDRSRRTHAFMHRKAMLASDPFWTAVRFPWGHNCFLPDTRIGGVVVGASRAMFSGDAVEVSTKQGRRLTVTANHPIVTTGGVVPARRLRVGDTLIGDLRQPGVHPGNPGSHGHEQDPPSTAEQVFGAFAERSDPVTLRAVRDDFHGEAQRFVGEVEVVGSYAGLPEHRHASGAEQLSQFDLEVPDHLPAFASDGSSLKFVLVGDSPTRRRVSRGDLTGPGMGRHSAPLHEFRSGSAAKLDAAMGEDAGDDLAADAAAMGKLLHRLAGQVALDEIVDVRQFAFCGHVFDFESKSGLVFANGLLASNCRCRKVSRTQEDIDRMGITVITGADVSGLPDPGWER